jgi:hypothetical protein
MRKAILAVALIALLAAGCGGESGNGASSSTGNLTGFSTPDGDIQCGYAANVDNLVCASRKANIGIGQMPGTDAYSSSWARMDENGTPPITAEWESPDQVWKCRLQHPEDGSDALGCVMSDSSGGFMIAPNAGIVAFHADSSYYDPKPLGR